MKFICLEMLRLGPTCDFFHDDRMELGSQACCSCVCFEMLRTALFYCNCYVINSPVS